MFVGVGVFVGVAVVAVIACDVMFVGIFFSVVFVGVDPVDMFVCIVTFVSI